MNWDQLLSVKRLGKPSSGKITEESRTEFQREYDRLIFSSPFRRLQNKTQVFPLPGSIFVHNRLTHSLEVASVGRSLGNMVAYIRSYSQEYFENTGIDCRITIPENLPELEVSGIIRRNVFLVVKEALNNIVKHSGATEVKITLQKEEKGLSLIIQDNGKGIDNQKLSQFGNGLKNMKKRMDDVGIEFSIEHINGTVVRLYREILG